MAPTKPTKSKGSSSKGSKGRSSAPPKSRATSKPSASKQKSKIPPKQHKPQQSNNRVKKKPRKYTDAELGIPKLNMITPAGVQKVKGKKKGKVFVDDPASMMTILAMVNADKEGQIESKMMRERQMQEIREARHQEMEAKQQEKKDKLEATKKSLRRSKKTKSTAAEEDQVETEDPVPKSKSKSGKKRVSFA